MAKKKIASGGSAKAKTLSARLAAVQGVYQAIHNDQTLKSVLDEYLMHRKEPPTQEEQLVQPDGALLKEVLLGVESRRNDLEEIITGHLKNPDKVPEPLIKSILLCGAYELLARGDVDAPIIINDYLNVTHSFYEVGEVSLVNGMLDSIARTLRN